MEIQDIVLILTILSSIGLVAFLAKSNSGSKNNGYKPTKTGRCSCGKKK